MNRNIIIVILFVSFIFTADKKVKDSFVKGQKSLKENSFLEHVTSDDPQVQQQIDRLKEQFKDERKAINKFYNQKHDILKKQKKDEIKQLKKQFKKRVGRLRKENPNSIKPIKMKPNKIKSEKKYIDNPQKLEPVRIKGSSVNDETVKKTKKIKISKQKSKEINTDKK